MFTRRLLPNVRKYYTINTASRSLKDKDLVAKHLYSKIKMGGPITVANYMKEILTSPLGGYYMHKDVFGKEGDFITSPEISQMFGELIAVWFLNEWSKAGSPKPVQLVEMGPGRGTLMNDILRVFQHFNALKGMAVQLVEISPFMSELQARRLCLQTTIIPDESALIYREGIGNHGVPIKWYRQFKDVPAAFTLLVAHEFFDALPIHKFKKTDKGYREVLVDINPDVDLTFRFCLSQTETFASKLFLNEAQDEHIEVSPDGLLLAKEIADKIENDGGLALIADYGRDGLCGDTFRAFKEHKQHDPLVEPGTADLTADVDFSALKKSATENNDVLAFGPVTQRDFLLRMGIEHRFEALKGNSSEEQLKSLEYGYRMVIDEDKMGERFKFLCLTPGVLKEILEKYPVVGFH